MDTVSKLTTEIANFLNTEILAPGVTVTNDTSLAEIGIDSVSIIELILFVDRRFDVRLPDSLLTPENLQTIQSLAECVLGQMEIHQHSRKDNLE